MPFSESPGQLRETLGNLFARTAACLRYPARMSFYVAQAGHIDEIQILPSTELMLEIHDDITPLSSYPHAVLESVFRTGNPILVEQSQLSEISNLDVYVVNAGITSFLCLPVVATEACNAAIWLERKDPLQNFSFAELDSLEQQIHGLQDRLTHHIETQSLHRLFNRDLFESELVFVSRDNAFMEGVRAVESHLRVFERAVKSADTGFVIVDARLPNQPIIYCNPAFERITGYSFRETVGKNCRFLQKPGEQDEKVQLMRDAILRGEPCQVLLKNYRKNGELFWNELTISPIRDAQGNLTHLIGVQNDVSDRVAIDVARKETESRFRALYDNSLDGICYYSLEGRCISANRAYCDLLGLTPEEVVGIHYADITPEKWREADRKVVQEQLFVRGYSDLYEKEYFRKDGSIVPVSVRAALHYDASGKPIATWGIVRDISEYRNVIDRLKQNEAHMEFLAYHDSLTAMPNRLLFQDRVIKALERAKRNGKKVALMLLDLDRFKNINDSLGHAMGDSFLKEISTRIQHTIREMDTAARIGGDEFVIVMENFNEISSVTAVANKLLKTLAVPINIQQHELYATASIGISIFPNDGQNVETLMKAADAAMYCAKEKGKNSFHYYTDDLNKRTLELLVLENDMRRALDLNQFFVAYQPQFALQDGALVGVEALLRWQHPVQGLLAPTVFIPLAEETGLIEPLGRWMLRASCTQIKAWVEKGYRMGRIAVNLSARQFRQPGLVEDIHFILSDVGLGAEHLELEITESIAMDNVESTVAKLEVLKRMGLRLSIDDFGTGYSSLSYLKRFAIDKLKIDQSFVRDIVTDPNDAAIAASTIALAHKMGLKVIAEGVETAEQVAFLREQGCDEVQGFFYGKPMSAVELERMLGTAPQRYRAGAQH
ncbi:MAG TPA: EAL domain-containing protein [Candidatus Kapabacteria bacterium]|nr:EAL domain-containing protein [Candidatus Kapabacteria bacterium]